MIRWRRTARLAVASAVVLMLGVASPASAGLTFTAGVIMNQPGYAFTAPQIGGRYIVAERTATTSDIVVYDRQTEIDVSIGYGDGKDQKLPAISGTRVAWIDRTEADGEVWYDDLADIIPKRRITTDANDDLEVAIDGNHIVWLSNTIVGRLIRWYDIERNEWNTVPGTNLPYGVTIDRGRICWFDTGKTAGRDGVYLYDIATAEETIVREVDYATTQIAPDSPTLHGDNVAWTQYPVADTDNKDIFATNVRTGESGQVTSNPETQSNPSAFGDILAWQDDRLLNQDIYCWWRPELGYQEVGASTDSEEYPDVFGRSVVFQRNVGEMRVALSVAPVEPRRISGLDRYATSAAIARERFGASVNAVLATGEDFPDALCASALAGALDAPLLLTTKSVVPSSVTDALADLGVDNVWIVGGTGVVAPSVDAQLTAAGITVMPRVSGLNRYETAKQVAYLVMDIVQSDPDAHWRKEAFFVRGDDFADALSVAPHAYNEKIPILLVETGSVPAATEEAVTFCYLTEGHIIGGTGAVSDATATEIGTLLGDAADRWSGTDRYATSASCAAHGVARGWLDLDDLGIATGLAFADALSGGASCGYYGSPLILARPTGVDTATDAFLTPRRYGFGGMTVFGGAGAISDASLAALGGYLD